MKPQLFIFAACLLSLPVANATADDHTQVTYNEVSVHDPSIVASGKYYYVFGSHLGAARSADLLNWKTFGGGETAYCSLFAKPSGLRTGYANAYSEHAVKKVTNYKGESVTFGNFDAHDWQSTGSTIQGNQWAPDVIYNKKTGKWMMYMSVNGDHWCSSIVCLTSKYVDGPYIYQGPVVFSGFQGTYDHNGFTRTDDWTHTDLAVATGVTALPARYNVGSRWGTYWPNCIDPCVFYGEDGNLYMTYGSWSGGIWEIRLDESTGLRDYTHTYAYQVNGKNATPGAANANTTSDPYFGKKIAGGYYVSGEGSYVKHIGNYYYLFMSYGGLNPNAGYVMRVFRSDSPEGPFTDGKGTSAVYNSYQLNYGNNSATNRGMKLMGAYGSWGAMTTGERAQGHNSAYVDDNGNAFVVYHTKFDNGTYGHQVRVHQLFVNSEGWLVAAPFRFTGLQTTTTQVATERLFAADKLVGTYKVLIHPYKQNCAYNDNVSASYSKANEQEPHTVTLNADGTISGDMTGKWALTQEGTSYITLSLNGREYNGVTIRQNMDYYADVPAVCITAVSQTGVPAWLYKEETSTGIQSVRVDHNTTDGKTYNLLGQVVDSHYQGVVIVNGKKVLRR